MERPRVLQEFGAFIDYAGASIRPNRRFYDEEAGGTVTGVSDPCVNGVSAPCIDGALDGAIEVDYVPACSMLVRAEVFGRVGLLDESFFLYWDDMDFAVRVKRAGYKVYAVSNSRVRHNLGTSNKKNLLPTYYFWRNRIRFFLKYGGSDSLDALASDIYTAVFTCRHIGKPNTLGVLKRAVSDGFADVGGPFDAGVAPPDAGVAPLDAGVAPLKTAWGESIDFTPDMPNPILADMSDSCRRIEVGQAILDARAQDTKPANAPSPSPQIVYADAYGNVVHADRAIILKAQYYAEKAAFVSALKETGRVR